MIKRLKYIGLWALLTAAGIAGTSPAVSAAESIRPLIIGLIPEQNIFDQLNRYEPLADYLGEKIGKKIKLKMLVRYGNIIDNFVSAQMDGAFFGSFTYALAHVKLDLESIARPEDISGRSTYHGLIFVRKDSGIRSIQDMREKIFAFVDRATTAGYLFPLVYFKENGIENYHRFLKETYFTGTHQASIYDVLTQKADIGAAKNTVFARISANDARIKNELMVLKRSPNVPENGLCVRKNLDFATKHKFRKALLDMHTTDEGKRILQQFGANRFIVTKNDDYINVYRFAKAIGLDLASYNYLNK